MNQQQIDQLWTNLRKANNTSLPPQTIFNGYHKTIDSGTIIALFSQEGHVVEKLTGIGFVVFDQTVFYALGGGQNSDHGILSKGNKNIIVYDLNKQIYKKVYVHLVNCHDVEIRINEQLEQKIDQTRRNNLTKNHTAQHLLSYNIEEILASGEMTDSVQIKEDYALLSMNKSDFWLNTILQARKKIIEELINHNIPQIEKEIPLEKAYALGIAHPSFEYDAIVRVIEFSNATIDLCGGTHVENLQEITFFDLWDCWIEKRKVKMQFSTSQEKTLHYYQTWYNQKVESINSLITKITTFDLDFNFTLPTFIIPTNFVQKIKVCKEFNSLELELNEIAKEKYKIMVQQISDITYPHQKIKINSNLTMIRFDINNPAATLELIRPKLNKYNQEYQKSLIVFTNQALKYSVISFTKDLKYEFNLNHFLQTKKDENSLVGGGTQSFINVTFLKEIDSFLESLLKALGNKS